MAATDSVVHAHEKTYTDEDIMKILISTDNHVGYLEKDPIRGEDSFLAFEEVLHTAQQQEADLVILAGDLFHENRPSRYTTWRTMEILRKYIMGSNPVRVQLESSYAASRILSSIRSSAGHASTESDRLKERNTAEGAGAGQKRARQADVRQGDVAKRARATEERDDTASSAKSRELPFIPLGGTSSKQHGAFDRVNWEDPYVNIGLPLFTIHGNHDDPTRDGPPDAVGATLSALDVLSMANLVNYFGKPEASDSIQVAPVLLRKGQTRLALYGLGGMREDTMVRAFNGDNVKFLRPADGHLDDWFTMLLIHQNRSGRSLGNRDAVFPIESLLPSWMDMIIWGHEHECMTGVSTAEGRRPGLTDERRETKILQPGSTVATSLCEGEEQPKHVFILKIRGFQFQTTPVRLACVRPFVMESIQLSQLGASVQLSPDTADVTEKIEELLKNKTEELIKQSMLRVALLTSQGKCPPKRMSLPLIRLKVDHTGFSTMPSLPRFGTHFLGRVANPQDILLMHKRAVRAPATVSDAAGASISAFNFTAGRPILPGLTHTTTVEELLKRHLESAREAGRGISLLGQSALQEALQSYISGSSSSVKTLVDGVHKACKAEALLAATASGELDADVVLVQSRDALKGTLARHARDAASATEAILLGKSEQEQESDAKRRAIAALEARAAEDRAAAGVGSSSALSKAASKPRGRAAAADSGNGDAKTAPASRGRSRGRGRGTAGGARGKRVEASDDEDMGARDTVAYDDEDDLDADTSGAKSAPVRIKVSEKAAARSTERASAAAATKAMKGTLPELAGGRAPRQAALQASKAMAAHQDDEWEDEIVDLDDEEEEETEVVSKKRNAPQKASAMAPASTSGVKPAPKAAPALAPPRAPPSGLKGAFAHINFGKPPTGH